MGIEDIIALAKNRGVDVIAITDHDCQAAAVRGKIIGERNGVKVIPGVELSATDAETDRIIHILCYLPDYPDRLEGLCHKNAAAAKRASQYMMHMAAKRFSVSVDVIRRCASGSVNIYKQHIMHALMECGLTDAIYSDLHSELFAPGAENGIYVKPSFAPVEEVLETIHAAGGIAVLAHPVLYGETGMNDLIDRLLPLGLDGIEVWHPSADEAQTAALHAIGKAKKLLMTGGSDFHGMYNRRPLTIGDYATPKTQLSELLGYKAKLRRQAKKAMEEAAE